MSRSDEIVSTEGLIEALNRRETPFGKEPLREWVRRFIAWFSKQPMEVLTHDILAEYLILAEISADASANSQLLQDWFCSLCNRIHQGQFGDRKVIEAVDSALQSIDKRIFRDDPSLLIKLADELLAKLDPSKTTFTRETYPTHGTVLCALHQTFVVLRHVAPNQLDPSQKRGLYQSFKEQLCSLSGGRHYYPIRYHAQLIEVSVSQLGMDRRRRLRPDRGRFISGIKGALYIFKGIRALVDLDFDVEAMEQGYQSLQEAFARQSIEDKPWYAWIQRLNYASFLTSEKPDQENIFGNCYQMLRSKETSMKNKEDRKAVRFGIIYQLQLMAMNGPTKAIQAMCRTELVQLAGSCELNDGWFKDADLVEALLNALSCVAILRFENEEVRCALERILSSSNETVRSTGQQWLGSLTLEEKLMSIPGAPSHNASGALFRAVKREIVESPMDIADDSNDVSEARTLLKKHYQRPQFTKMDVLFDGYSPKHIQSIQCHLMLLEHMKPGEESESEPEEVEVEGDQLSTLYERSKWKKTPILPDDLFRRRTFGSNETVQDVKKVLLTGGPGTGKTTLARHLAFLWASGEWGQEFDFVFLLQVRELKASRYDDSNDRREETLATAIANTCYPRCSKDAYLALRDQIEEVLDVQTTLVILDGLDENRGASESILQEAKNGNCMLLLLGRPYGVQEDRRLADIEVEHVGFTDAQLMQCFRSELFPAQANELITFTEAAPVIWKISHIPVNAQILCALWKDPRMKDSKKSLTMCLAMLYRRMTYFTWERFVQKFDEENIDAMEVFDTLGCIAFESLKQGQILIDESLVQDQARTRQMKKILKESGFLLLQSIGFYYEFPHLTFQEYFAGRWLARRFSIGSPDEKEKVKEFLDQNKYSTEFKLVLSFMMGEACITFGSDGGKKLLATINEAPKEVLGVQHLILELWLIDDYLSTTTKQIASLRFDAVSNLKELLLASRKNTALLKILTEALTSMPSIVYRFPELLDALMAICQERRCCHVAMTTIVGILPFVPCAIPHVEETMAQMFVKSDAKLKVEIVKLFREIVRAFPKQSQLLLSLVVSACNNEHSRVREASQITMAVFLQASKEASDVVVESITAGCSDELYSVREQALNAIERMVDIAPQKIPAVLDTVITGCWDAYDTVRLKAVGLVRKMIQKSPESLPRIKEFITSASSGVNVEIRKHAIESIGSIVKGNNDCCAQFVDVLIRGCEDRRSDVRAVAAKSVGEVARALPDHCPRIVDTLVNAFEDELYTVRKAVMLTIGRITPFVAPSSMERLVSLLQSGIVDSDFLVRIATIEAAGELMKHDRDQAFYLVDAVVNASQDEAYAVRTASIKVIGETIAATETPSPYLLEKLTTACNDPYAHVRSAALENIIRYIDRCPEYVFGVIDSLKQARYTEDTSTKKGMLEMIAQLIRVAPDQCPVLAELLTFAFDDPDHKIRSTLLSVLVEILPLHADRIPNVVERMFALCMDGVHTVQQPALERMKQLLHVRPEDAAQILELAKQACKDPKGHNRSAGFEILRELVKVHPEEIPDVMQLVYDGVYDKRSYVRQEALLAAEEIMKTDAGQFENLVELLFKACNDLYGKERRTVIEAMASVLDFAPKQFSRFVPSLVTACDDLSYYVRRAAFEIIEKIIQNRPDLIPDFLPPLLTAYHQTSPQNRFQSAELLQRIPAEVIIDCFWDSSLKSKLAAVLVPRLHQVPLIIVPSSTLQDSIVQIHLEGMRSMQWDKPHEIVQSFIELVHTSHQQTLNAC